MSFPTRQTRLKSKMKHIALFVSVLVALLCGSAGEATCRADRGKALKHYRQAEKLYLRSQFEQSLAELKAGYAEDRDPEFLYNMGKVQEKIGRVAEAVALYRRYLTEAPDGDRRDKAERRLQSLAGADASATDHYAQARQHYVKGEYNVAIGELGAGFDKESDPNYLYNLAKTYQKADHPEKAVQYYNSYLTIAPHGEFADKAKEQRDALAATLLRLKKPLPPTPLVRPPAPPEREPRPIWRIVGSVAVLGAGAAMVGIGAWALPLNGRCTQPAESPMQYCAKLYDTKTYSEALLGVGGALVVAGVVGVALPGKRVPLPAPVFSSRGAGVQVMGGF